MKNAAKIEKQPVKALHLLKDKALHLVKDKSLKGDSDKNETQP